MHRHKHTQHLCETVNGHTVGNRCNKNRNLNEVECRTVLSEVTSSTKSRPIWTSSEGDLEQPPISCCDLLMPGDLPKDPEMLNLTIHPKRRYDKFHLIVNVWLKL